MAIANQTSDCDSLLEDCTRHLAVAGQWREHISTLRADLVSNRKSIAVEIDEMFR